MTTVSIEYLVVIPPSAKGLHGEGKSLSLFTSCGEEGRDKIRTLMGFFLFKCTVNGRFRLFISNYMHRLTRLKPVF